MPHKFGVDYAWGDPGIEALKTAGAKFVCRYLSTPGNSKNLRVDEAKQLQKAGIDIVSVFETTATRALGGFAAGEADAKSAARQLADLGAPPRTPVYFAVDFDATSSEQRRINDYLAGAASAIGKDRVGVYGGYWVVKRALDAAACKYAWQTYAWSAGRIDTRAHLHQYSNGHRLNGVSVDYNHTLKPDFGQWPIKPKPKVKDGFWPWLRYFLGEKPDKGYKPPLQIPVDWWRRAALFLKARKRV